MQKKLEFVAQGFWRKLSRPNLCCIIYFLWLLLLGVFASQRCLLSITREAEVTVFSVLRTVCTLLEVLYSKSKVEYQLLFHGQVSSIIRFRLRSCSRCVFTLKQNCLTEFINVISGKFGELFKPLKKLGMKFCFFVSLQHSITFSLAHFTLRMMLVCSLCSVHIHCDFLPNCSQLKNQLCLL